MDNIKNDTVIGFPIIQNQQDFIIGKFNISQIFKFTRYTTRILNSFDEDGTPLYNNEIQREIEKSRVEKIADFLIEDPEATFPTNIVLHIPKEAIEEQKEHLKFVEIKIKEAVFNELNKKNGHVYITVIDGQHRIRGIEVALARIKNDIEIISQTLVKSPNNLELNEKLSNKTQRLEDLQEIELVVSFFIDKTIEYQAMIFSTINRTQKRVSQSLVYDLFGLDLDDTPQKTAIQCIIALNGHKKSPFYNRIKFYGGDYSPDSSPPLSQATMAKSIVGLISENLRQSEIDRHKKRHELKSRTQGSLKFLPFRRYYVNNEDSVISDILFFYFKSIEERLKDKRDVSYWKFTTANLKPTNILQTTVGYEALLNILVDILKNEELVTFKSSSVFEPYIEKCKDIDYGNINTFTFNNRGKKMLYLEMSLKIYPAKERTDKRLVELENLKSS